MLRDNLSVIAANLLRLGLHRSNYTLVLRPGRGGTDASLYEHYFSYVATNLTTWPEILAVCGYRCVYANHRSKSGVLGRSKQCMHAVMFVLQR